MLERGRLTTYDLNRLEFGKKLSGAIVDMVHDDFYWAVDFERLLLYRAPIQKVYRRTKKGSKIVDFSLQWTDEHSIFHPKLLASFVLGRIRDIATVLLLKSERDRAEFMLRMKRDRRVWVPDDDKRGICALASGDVRRFIDIIADMHICDQRKAKMLDEAVSHHPECLCGSCRVLWEAMRDRMPLAAKWADYKRFG